MCQRLNVHTEAGSFDVFTDVKYFTLTYIQTVNLGLYNRVLFAINQNLFNGKVTRIRVCPK